MIVLICGIISILILSLSFILRKKTVADSFVKNEELDKFYSMYSEPVSVQMRQLILAAKTTLSNVRVLSKENDVISELYNDRVISENYYRKYKGIEEDLVLEKTIIGNESEMLKPGSKDFVFIEAKKILESESSSKKSQSKIFNDAQFLKKQDSLLKDLKDRLVEQYK